MRDAAKILEEAIEAQARSLRDFGYSSVTTADVQDAHDNWKKGEQAVGIIEMFCQDAFRDHPELFGKRDA